MASYQDHMVVLKARAYRDYDSLVTLFGLKSGKIAAIAKGARRPKSALSGRISPLSYSQVGLYRGRSGLETVTEAELVEGFARIAADLTRISWGMALADLVDELWEEREASPATFSVLVAALEALNDGRPATGTGLAAGWQLLGIAGYLPDLNHCGRCHRPVDNGPVEVALAQPAVYCGRCQSAERVAGRIQISLGSLRSLQYWVALPPKRLGQGEAKGQIKEECLGLWLRFARWQLGRSPRSFEFLNTVEAPDVSPRK
ncbi:MAG: DNA repair protein RecO [Thermaerobacter sp.]|nr:DNA repair protein RecO [Thermaerobacter sp.]